MEEGKLQVMEGILGTAWGNEEWKVFEESK